MHFVGSVYYEEGAKINDVKPSARSFFFFFTCFVAIRTHLMATIQDHHVPLVISLPAFIIAETGRFII